MVIYKEMRNVANGNAEFLLKKLWLCIKKYNKLNL